MSAQLTHINSLLDRLPFGKGYRFVDAIEAISDDSITGRFCFRESLSFFDHHFPNQPIVPGAMLGECAAQIGLATFGMHLSGTTATSVALPFVLVHQDLEFLAPVMPNETITVYSSKVYFRFGKLKCSVQLTNSAGTVVCRGTLSGMILKPVTNE